MSPTSGSAVFQSWAKSAAHVAGFFVDESQGVTLDDVGDKDTLRQWAAHVGATVEEMTLASPFRCNGADGYLAWRDPTLQIRETANDTLDVAEFDFRLVDSPTERRRLLLEKNRERNRARRVAGDCWKWPSQKDPAAWDIVIPEHGFQARWNLTRDGGLWRGAEESVHEVGGIPTCQGLEADTLGVIVGDDLVVRDGEGVTRPERRASSDRSIQGWKQLAKVAPDRAREKTDAIIKNTPLDLADAAAGDVFCRSWTVRSNVIHGRSRRWKERSADSSRHLGGARNARSICLQGRRRSCCGRTFLWKF